jgi:Putative transposase
MKWLAKQKAFQAFLRPLFRKDWVVYAKRPFGGPELVLHYLARYTHRVSISNHRIVNFADGKVTFRWKGSSAGKAVSSASIRMIVSFRQTPRSVTSPACVIVVKLDVCCLTTDNRRFTLYPQ